MRTEVPFSIYRPSGVTRCLPLCSSRVDGSRRMQLRKVLSKTGRKHRRTNKEWLLIRVLSFARQSRPPLPQGVQEGFSCLDVQPAPRVLKRLR